MSVVDQLRTFKTVRTPDLWGQIERRVSQAGEGDSPQVSARPWRRLATVIAALVIAGAGLTALIMAFHGKGGAALSVGPRPNGVIATLDRGATGELGIENVDLVAIDPATGRRVNLTPGPEAESEPVWSPDGTRVAFLRTEASPDGSRVSISRGLFVMNADGSSLHEVYPCSSAEQCEVREFAWSPDDRYLAWSLERRQNEGGSELQILDVSTGSVIEVCARGTCGQSLRQLAWAPDSGRLAFTDAAGGISGFAGPPASSIWLVDPDGGHLTRLTEGRGCYSQKGPVNYCYADTSPAWSPEGGTLAFLHQKTGGGQPDDAVSMVLMAPDGSDVREIAPCGDSQSCEPSTPHWSPDGTSILFATGYDQTAQVHLLDPATGTVTDVPADGDPDCIDPVEPSWSPDGRQIAFVGGPGRVANLCVLPREGGTPQVVLPHFAGYRLTFGIGFTWLPAGAIDVSSASPSGTPTSEPSGSPLPPGTIVFTSSNGSNQEDDGVEIWSMASDGTGARPLTTNGVADSSPAIAPDGSEIAFTRSGQVWVMDVDGSAAHPLTDLRGTAGSPEWSADGTQIAFRHSGGDRDGVPDGIYVMLSDGADPHLVASGNAFGYAWQPDDASITISMNTPDGGLHLRTVDLASGAVRPFLDLPGDQDAPAWSPDGSTLAFAWTSVGGSGMYLVDADGSNLRRVVGAPFTAGDSGLGIGWSPDGSWLSFEGLDDRTGPQIYAIRADGSGLRRLTDLQGFIAGTSIYGITGNPTWGP